MTRVVNSIECLTAVAISICITMTGAEPEPPMQYGVGGGGGHHHSHGVKYAGPIVYTNEKPPIIHFPPPPKGAGLGGWGKGQEIKYIPMPHHDLPILIYQSESNPPIHVVSPPRSSSSHVEYESSTSHNSSPNVEYGSPPSNEYGPPSSHHPQESYSASAKIESAPLKVEYGPPQSQYSPPSTEYGTPFSHGSESYGPPQQEYGSPSFSRPEYGAPLKFGGYGGGRGHTSHVSSSDWLPGPPPRRGKGGWGSPPPPHSSKGWGSPPPPPARKAAPAPHIIYQGHPPIHILHKVPEAPKAWSWPSSSSSGFSSASSSYGSNGDGTSLSSFYDSPSFHSQQSYGSVQAFSRASKTVTFSYPKHTPTTFKYGPPPSFDKGSLSSTYGVPQGNPISSFAPSSSYGSPSNEYGAPSAQSFTRTAPPTSSASYSAPSLSIAIPSNSYGPVQFGPQSSSQSRYDDVDFPSYSPQKGGFLSSQIPSYAPSYGGPPSRPPQHVSYGPPRSFFGQTKRSKFLLAPKAWHKPPIIIYAGVKPPVHVYKKPEGGWDSSNSVNSGFGNNDHDSGRVVSSSFGPDVSSSVNHANNDNGDSSYGIGSSSTGGEVYLPSATAPRPTILKPSQNQHSLKTIYVSNSVGSEGPFKTFLVTNSEPVQVQQIGYRRPTNAIPPISFTSMDDLDLDTASSYNIVSIRAPPPQESQSAPEKQVPSSAVIETAIEHPVAESRILPSNPDSIFQNLKNDDSSDPESRVISFIMSTESTENKSESETST